MEAKIFLSCGQCENSDEPQVAKRIEAKLGKLGFHCYVAAKVQSLRSLRENIFDQLRDTDYMVFVDFKREKLDAKKTHRGSLFANQELAIASFLEIPVVAFQERRVEKRHGMLGALHVNFDKFTTFSSRNALPDVVCKCVREKLTSKEWSNSTRNLLILKRASEPVDAHRPNDKATLRIFHLAVQNHHHRKAALNCFPYLDCIEDLRTAQQIPLKTVEYKWRGTVLQAVRIGPCQSREFDAFWFKHGNPGELGFGVATDSVDYYPRLPGPGTYRLTFSVVSDNFAPATKDFTLELGTTVDTVKFEEVCPDAN
jgi:hypothetical protein